MYPLIKNTLIKDLIERSPNLFREKVLYRLKPHYFPSNQSNKTILYPISHLPTLPIGDDKRIVKYIVSANKRLLLSRADHLERGHEDMTNDEVLAAGYLFLHDDRKILGISNESNVFEQQAPTSLLWPLTILQVNRALIADQFSLIDSNAQSEIQILATDRITITQALTKAQRAALREANASQVVLSRENGIESPAQTFFTGLTRTENTFERLYQSTLPFWIELDSLLIIWQDDEQRQLPSSG